MKNLKVFGIIALIAVMGLVTSCATGSSIGGTADAHGLFSQAKVVEDGGTQIASYSVILGLIDSGYADYATKVKAAEAEGKKITTVTTWLVFLTKTVAYGQ